MDALIAPIDDISAKLHEVVDRLGDELFIARNRRRRDDDRVARDDRDLAVIRRRHARERGHRLALTARRHDDDLIGAEIIDLVDADDCTLGRGEVAELQRDADYVLHAATEDGDAPLVLHGGVDDLLDAVDIRGETRNDDAPAHIVERLVQRRANRTLARRMPLALRVRAVREQEQHTLVAKI